MHIGGLDEAAVLKGGLVVATGLAVAAWFWFGLPPLGSPAIIAGSDYLGTSPISIAFVVAGLFVGLLGAVSIWTSRHHSGQ